MNHKRKHNLARKLRRK